MGQFSTVIWIGNDYAGDLGSWQQTSILPYLQAGGNLLLITRKGQSFIDVNLQEYLGITWAENPLSTINNCDAAFPGLMDMQFTDAQTLNAVFETGLTNSESTLLFHETTSFSTPRGLGVWRNPSEGGQFIFISGRPYYYNAEDLRANVEFILKYLFAESTLLNGTDPIEFRLEQNYPNPFNTSTTIRYYLFNPADVTINIYNIRGELIEVLLKNESKSTGPDKIVWNGKNNGGTRVSSGIYFYQMNINGLSKTKKMLLLR